MSSINAALTQTNSEFNQALSQSGRGSNLDKDSFMLLLVTQFKYQDPLNPMEDQEFIAQMAQFSSLEQLMNLNTSMDSLTEATNNQQMINATSYIGKMVSVSGNSIGKVTDGSTGETTISTFRYAFGDNVVSGTLSVRDATGNIVYSEDLAGKQSGTTFEFNWNGKTGAGMPAPDGVYTVNLSAFNSSGEAVLSDQVVDATVTGVVNQDGTVYLGMDGGQLLALANVRQVAMPKAVTAAGDDGSASDGGASEDNSSTAGEASDDGASVAGESAADDGAAADSGSADGGATDGGAADSGTNPAQAA